MLPILLIALAACTDEEPAPREEVRSETDVLELPSLEGLDMKAAYEDALRIALAVNNTDPWAGHVGTLDGVEAGCPDLYAGVPADNDIDVDEEDAVGMSWADHCTTGAGVSYNGYAYWETDVSVSGDPQTAEGLVSTASRTIIANGSVGTEDNVDFELDGEASDSMTLTEAFDYVHWTYTSLVEATVTGSDVFTPDSLTPEGWRTDLYVSHTGGDIQRMEMRGNTFFFTPVLHDRFDSFAMDIELPGPLGAGPDDCTEEPLGYIGLRDENAFWYDLVFLPRYEDDITGTDYPNDPLSVCDGCGNLYVRGVAVGEVCPDFGFAFNQAEPPDVSDFILSLRDLP